MRISDWSSDVCASDLRNPEVQGKEHVSVYHARGPAGDPSGVSPAERHFCKHCGSALYLYDSRWPELVHPLASAIDTPLPPAPESVYIMLESKPAWVKLPAEAKRADCYAEYPEERSEEHTSELQSLMRISYAVFCLKKKKKT